MLLWKSPHQWRTDKLYVSGQLDPDYCQHVGVFILQRTFCLLALHITHPTYTSHLRLHVLAVFADDGKTLYSGEFVHTPRSPFPVHVKTAR
jgi:hypothetical protein